MKNFKTIGLLLLIFLFSIIVRLPYIDDDVDFRGIPYIYTLITLENWQQEGLQNYYYSPVQTYNNIGDKGISYYSRLEDKRGNNYYVSFPPFTFLFSHFVLKILQINPSQLPLILMNLFFHFLSALFIYASVNLYFNKLFLDFFFPSLVAFIAYIYMPVMLYFHTDIYFPEMYGQVFWIIGIYLMLKILLFKHLNSKKYLLLICLLCFIIIYTEWIGIFFVATVCVILTKYSKHENKLLKGIILSSLFSILLILFQYSRINGWQTLMYYFGIRFSERSGLFGEYYSGAGKSIFSIDAHLSFLKHIHEALLGFGYALIAILLILILLKRIKLNSFAVSNKIILLLSLCIVPALLHFFIFFNSNASHYLGVAKLAVPVSVGWGLIFSKLTLRRQYLLNTLLIIIIGISIKLYYKKKQSYYYDSTYLKEVAELISKDAREDEVVLINIISNCPSSVNKLTKTSMLSYLTYVSKRNMMFVKNFSEAKEFMKSKNKEKAVYYQFDVCSGRNKISRFNY